MRSCDVCPQCKGKLSPQEREAMPLNCLCREAERLEAIKELYNEDENMLLAHNAALVESEGYLKKTRLEEIIDFAHKCGYRKLGLAFCVGLHREAKVFCRILRDHGFQVNSVVCKNGGISKDFIGISDSQQVRSGTYEAMCNPIGQAVFLNNEKTELNILLGLCVGLDTLFIKYSEAPITVFAVKDRVLAHNPLAAVYVSESYFKNRFEKPEEENK